MAVSNQPAGAAAGQAVSAMIIIQVLTFAIFCAAPLAQTKPVCFRKALAGSAAGMRCGEAFLRRKEFVLLVHPIAADAAGAVSAADAHMTLLLMFSGVMPGGVENVDSCVDCSTTAKSSASLLACCSTSTCSVHKHISTHQVFFLPIYSSRPAPISHF